MKDGKKRRGSAVVIEQIIGARLEIQFLYHHNSPWLGPALCQLCQKVAYGRRHRALDTGQTERKSLINGDPGPIRTGDLPLRRGATRLCSSPLAAICAKAVPISCNLHRICSPDTYLYVSTAAPSMPFRKRALSRGFEAYSRKGVSDIAERQRVIWAPGMLGLNIPVSAVRFRPPGHHF